MWPDLQGPQKDPVVQTNHPLNDPQNTTFPSLSNEIQSSIHINVENIYNPSQNVIRIPKNDEIKPYYVKNSDFYSKYRKIDTDSPEMDNFIINDKLGEKLINDKII
jgi:hypothetical protein